MSKFCMRVKYAAPLLMVANTRRWKGESEWLTLLSSLVPKKVWIALGNSVCPISQVCSRTWTHRNDCPSLSKWVRVVLQLTEGTRPTGLDRYLRNSFYIKIVTVNTLYSSIQTASFCDFLCLPAGCPGELRHLQSLLSSYWLVNLQLAQVLKFIKNTSSDNWIVNIKQIALIVIVYGDTSCSTLFAS